MKALVLLNGYKAPRALVDEARVGAGLIICADGAANWAMPYGVMPDILIGDMDSCRPELIREVERSGGGVVKLPTHKDATDGMFAVDAAIEAGATEVVVLGGIGTRIDHTLANVHLLVRLYHAGLSAVLLDEHNEVRVTDGRLELFAKPGAILSVLPLESGITVHSLYGLEYPLDEYELTLDFPRAISNVFVGDMAVVDLSGGMAAVVIALD